MKPIKLTIHQKNMYCDKCLINVLKALSVVDKIESLGIDLENKRITLEYEDERFGKDAIRKMIDQAITRGIPIQPALVQG